MSTRDEYNFNKNKGLTHYITPFTSIFCVLVKNAPEFAYFFKSDLTVPSKEAI